MRNVDELLDVEIGVRRTAATKTIGLVGQCHEQRVHIRIGIDGDGLEPVVAAGADDAHGDFAAIGNQHFLHRGLLTVFCAPSSSARDHAFAGVISANRVMGRKRILAFTGICPARSR